MKPLDPTPLTLAQILAAERRAVVRRLDHKDATEDEAEIEEIDLLRQPLDKLRENAMGKPPTTDQELTARVEALETRMTEADADIDMLVAVTHELNDRVTALEAGAVIPTPPPDGERTPLTVRINYNGVAVTLQETAGIELDAYVDPEGKFEQRCIKVTDPALPDFVVHIRPDRDGSREEVVFELGAVRSTESIIMSNFMVTVMRGDEVLCEWGIPHQWYRSRWRWQSEPRPVRHTIAELMAANLIPHYAEELATQTPASSVQTYKPMGFAGITTQMGGTGERPDIGPMTEWQADYICTGRNLDTVLAQGEACNSFPWWYRDEDTDAPIDTFVELKASSYNSSSPAPYLFGDWRLNPDNPDAIARIQCDTAHHPNLSYLPFLLTGDPYYLEGLHTIVNFNILSQPWNGRMFNIYFAIRAHAWALRCAAEAALVTPEITPNWMLPKSYFVRHLEDNRDWMLSTYLGQTTRKAPPKIAPEALKAYGLERLVGVDPYAAEGSAVAWARFATTEQSFGDNDESPKSPQGTYSQTYMEEFSLFILCWVVQLGFTDWRPIAEWKVKNTVERTNGQSGWIRAVSTPYRENLRPARDQPWCADRAASWALTEERYGLTYSDPDTLPASGNDISYPTYTEGALAIAKAIGIAAAEPSHTWIHDQVDTLIAGSTGRFRARKWCVAAT